MGDVFALRLDCQSQIALSLAIESELARLGHPVVLAAPGIDRWEAARREAAPDSRVGCLLQIHKALYRAMHGSHDPLIRREATHG